MWLPHASARSSCYDRNPTPQSGSTSTASARRPDHVPRPGTDASIRSDGIATRRSARSGGPLFRVARYVEWCGHGPELIPLPDEREWVRFVPVIGTGEVTLGPVGF